MARAAKMYPATEKRQMERQTNRQTDGQTDRQICYLGIRRARTQAQGMARAARTCPATFNHKIGGSNEI